MPKGVYKRSRKILAHLRKLAKIQKGKTFEERFGKERADELKRQVAHYGKDNPSKRLEVRKKQSDARKNQPPPTQGKHWKWSDDARMRQSVMALVLRKRGKYHHNWKGGISRIWYPSEFNKLKKQNIRKRDNFKCWLCGITEKEHIKKYGKPLYVNHIDFDKKNCSDDNLSTLCAYHNSIINYNRGYWTAYFQKEMVRRNKRLRA